MKKDMILTAKFVTDEEATHGEDIAFQTTCGIWRYNSHANRYEICHTVIPTNAQDQSVEWSTSDESYATVDENGWVTFQDPGDEPREITVTAKLKYGKTRTFTLWVTNDELPMPESIAPEVDSVELAVGKQAAFCITTQPSPAFINEYSYRSDDEGVVTVDENGVLTAVGAGQTQVHVATTTYTASSDSIDLEATMSVIVTEDEPPTPPSPAPPTAKKSIKGATVTGLATKTYTGSAIKPKVTVNLGGKTLVKGTDYELAYSDNVKPGKATVKITGVGNYKDTVSKKFKIIPKKPVITRVKALEKGFKVTWKKQAAKQATGYEVRWSLKKSMKSAKKKTIGSNKTKTYKKMKLKPGKTYYVQVRSYKLVNGKKYYSKWSAKKLVKTKSS